MRTVRAADIFNLFDEYKGLLSQNEIQSIFDAVFHKSALTYNSNSSYKPSFDPLKEFEKRIAATVEVKTDPTPLVPQIAITPKPDEVTLARLQKANEAYIKLQNNPLGGGPANKNELLKRKINEPLQALIAQAKKGVNVSAETTRLIIIISELTDRDTGAEKIKKLPFPSSSISQKLKDLTADIKDIKSTPQQTQPTPCLIPNKRAGFIAIGSTQETPKEGGMRRAARPPRTIKTSFPEAITQGKILETTPFDPSAVNSNKVIVVEPHTGSSPQARTFSAPLPRTPESVKILSLINKTLKFAGIVGGVTMIYDVTIESSSEYAIAKYMDIMKQCGTLKNPSFATALWGRIKEAGVVIGINTQMDDMAQLLLDGITKSDFNEQVKDEIRRGVNDLRDINECKFLFKNLAQDRKFLKGLRDLGIKTDLNPNNLELREAVLSPTRSSGKYDPFDMPLGVPSFGGW